MSAHPVPNASVDPRDEPVMLPGQTYASVTDQVADVVLYRPTGPWWYLGVATTLLFVLALVTSVGMLIIKGVGVGGINIPGGASTSSTSSGGSASATRARSSAPCCC